MNDTPTPRTDACAKSIDQSNFADSWKDDFDEFAWVPADFARILECELIAAREEIKELNDKLDDAVADATNAVNDIIRMKWQRDRLAEAIRKHKFDDVKLWQALQSLNQDHTVAANDMIAAVKGGADEIPR